MVDHPMYFCPFCGTKLQTEAEVEAKAGAAYVGAVACRGPRIRELMAGTFKFELVTPERMVLSQDASQVVVPGVEGEFTVLPGHAPVISALRPGVVDATLGDARNIRVFVKGGFAEVDADRRDGIGGARPERRNDGCGRPSAMSCRLPKPISPPPPAMPTSSPPLQPSSN